MSTEHEPLQGVYADLVVKADEVCHNGLVNALEMLNLIEEASDMELGERVELTDKIISRVASPLLKYVDKRGFYQTRKLMRSKKTPRPVAVEAEEIETTPRLADGSVDVKALVEPSSVE